MAKTRPSETVTAASNERAVGMLARLFQVPGGGSGGLTLTALFGTTRESVCRSAVRASARAITSTTVAPSAAVPSVRNSSRNADSVAGIVAERWQVTPGG